MNMNKKWMTLILLFLGAMIASGCAISKEGMMAYNDAKDAFQKATLADAKKCAPCEYATAEAYLAQVDHEIAERDAWRGPGHFDNAVKIAKEKSLEAIKLCEKPPAPRAAPAPPPPPPPPPCPQLRRSQHHHP